MTTATKAPDVRHESYCRPPLARGDGPEGTPRMETYLAYEDVGNDSIPTFRVHRCLECGAAEYQPNR